MTDNSSAVAVAHYDTFSIEEVVTGGQVDYRLSVGGFRTAEDFEWDAGDALSRYDGALFTARDRDNSGAGSGCLTASGNHAGW